MTDKFLLWDKLDMDWATNLIPESRQDEPLSAFFTSRQAAENFIKEEYEMYYEYAPTKTFEEFKEQYYILYRVEPVQF